MSWTAPRRPAHKVSQTFNDGVVFIYAERDAAAPGYAPQIALSLRTTLSYAERRVGVQRYYSASQNQSKVERLLRVPKNGLVSNLDRAVTEDGQVYRVDLVQTVPDVWPPCVDLTLVAYRQREAGHELV